MLPVSSCRILRNGTSDTGSVWPPYPRGSWKALTLYALWCPIPGHREHLPPTLSYSHSATNIHRTSLLHLIFLLCPEAMELKVNLLQLCGLLHTESNRGFL